MIFSYIPMYGIVIVFKDYRPSSGIPGSPWKGFEHFEGLFGTAEFPRVLRNTIVISFIKLAFRFPAPPILALLRNELAGQKLKKGMQTAIYPPHFISWGISANLHYNLFSLPNGIVNNLVALCGGGRINFMTSPAFAYPILIFS